METSIEALKKIGVKIKIGNSVFTPDLSKELSISESSINEDIADQASRYAFYAMQYAIARNAAENYSAQFIRLLRETYIAEGEKYTEKRLEQERDNNEKYQELKSNERILQSVKVAFEQRKDMLITIASNFRHELDQAMYKHTKEKGK